MNYHDLYQQAQQDPQRFWQRQAANLPWFKQPTSILDSTFPTGQWFKDGEINMSYAALDVHVNAGHGDLVAIYYDSPVPSTIDEPGSLKDMENVINAHGAA